MTRKGMGWWFGVLGAALLMLFVFGFGQDLIADTFRGSGDEVRQIYSCEEGSLKSELLGKPTACLATPECQLTASGDPPPAQGTWTFIGQNGCESPNEYCCLLAQGAATQEEAQEQVSELTCTGASGLVLSGTAGCMGLENGRLDLTAGHQGFRYYPNGTEQGMYTLELYFFPGSSRQIKTIVSAPLREGHIDFALPARSDRPQDLLGVLRSNPLRVDWSELNDGAALDALVRGPSGAVLERHSLQIADPVRFICPGAFEEANGKWNLCGSQWAGSSRRLPVKDLTATASCIQSGASCIVQQSIEKNEGAGCKITRASGADNACENAKPSTRISLASGTVLACKDSGLVDEACVLGAVVQMAGEFVTDCFEVPLSDIPNGESLEECA